jgi:hypothetical protein
MSKARRLAAARTAGTPPSWPPVPPVDAPSLTTPERQAMKAVWYDDLVRALRVLATRDDGWLRLIPDVDRQRVWLKWKFTRGPHERHYIMVSTEDMRVHHGLQVLVQKLYDVDLGQLKPTLDRLYEEEG